MSFKFWEVVFLSPWRNSSSFSTTKGEQLWLILKKGFSFLSPCEPENPYVPGSRESRNTADKRCLPQQSWRRARIEGQNQNPLDSQEDEDTNESLGGLDSGRSPGRTVFSHPIRRAVSTICRKKSATLPLPHSSISQYLSNNSYI